MKLFPRLLLFLFTSKPPLNSVLYVTPVTVLVQSDYTTPLVFPTTTFTASPANYNWGLSIASAPTAFWIWDSSGGVTAECNMTIRVIEKISVMCLNQPLTLYVTADNIFTSSLNGVSGSGDAWNVLSTYTIPTTNVPCGKLIN
jgi:hypothetical protein